MSDTRQRQMKQYHAPRQGTSTLRAVTENVATLKRSNTYAAAALEGNPQHSLNDGAYEGFYELVLHKEGHLDQPLSMQDPGLPDLEASQSTSFKHEDEEVEVLDSDHLYRRIILPETVYADAIVAPLRACAVMAGTKDTAGKWKPITSILMAYLQLAIVYVGVVFLLMMAWTAIKEEQLDHHRRRERVMALSHLHPKVMDRELFQESGHANQKNVSHHEGDLVGQMAQAPHWTKMEWEEWEAPPKEMVWQIGSAIYFCQDVIDLHVKHLIHTGNRWYKMFVGIILLIWCLKMWVEFVETWELCCTVIFCPVALKADEMVQYVDEKGELRARICSITKSLKGVILLSVLVPKIVINFILAFVGTQFLLGNALRDSVEELLLATIELAFVLEFDELVYAAITSWQKKQLMEKCDLPEIELGYFGRSEVFFGEPTRILILVGMAVLLTYLHFETEIYVSVVLPIVQPTSEEHRVYKGCCNFYRYLQSGGGHPVHLYHHSICAEYMEWLEQHNHEAPFLAS
eukprot:gnl/MRDRNA2_/MRDRNA2_26157_c0_seq1.p1 gnl/MRDRNA2_/MRDRNA2_26157_c0~~gnl/MRDRNA2_/MRDRNA2_26157_c0_seq1.p1  ORF type:complete len:517 (-),score=80.95 gnl/MRDRNA2_/MRDRNA2_26157_c0_seq1:4-1554(-)